ncbi:hypothetical protein BGZ50_007823 [Haplosporangium sp. Z 11]|nr:hypothetical protein BGZ50_007823 [Haplosporangium sp. Z 11]
MADPSNISPCKVSFNGDFRRFLIGRPAIRNVYNLSATTAINVHYKDEEGDVITLSTDSELDDVLSMHALFNQVAPVRFEITLQDQHTAHSDASSTPTPITGYATQSDVQEEEREDTRQHERSITVTSDYEDMPLLRHSSHPQEQKNPFGSEHSDDGSLIDFEDAIDNGTLDESALNQNIAYPQDDLYEAALRQEQETSKTHQLGGLVFPSSVTDATKNDMDTEDRDKVKVEAEAPQAGSTSRRTSSSTSSVLPPVIEFEALRMDGASEVMDSIVASAIEQHAQEAAAPQTQVWNGANADDHADPAEPEINPEASTSASGDRALLEQFQMLIQEFQHVIQNNPQLVELAGSIMQKILSNVKVNVESFAASLQEFAQEAATRAATQGHDAAAQAHEAATRAATQAHEAATEAAAAASMNWPFGSGKGSSFSFFAHNEDPFSGSHPDPFFRHGRGGHCGRRSSRGHGSCSSRGGGHHGWNFGRFFAPVPPMPPTPPMPPMPGMPPMPSMPPMPGMPPMPSMSPMPGMPFSRKAFCGRSTTVPTSKSSPFSRGFPFNSSPPDCKGSFFKFKCDRPSPRDTEATNERGSSSKAAEANVGSSSTSAMPGSFPQMTEIDKGWTWTELPQGTAGEGSKSSSSRPRYGWVWTGGESGEEQNPEPTPLYTESDEEMPQAPHDAPHGRAKTGERGRHNGPFRGGRGRGGVHQAFFHPHHPGHAHSHHGPGHHHHHHGHHGHHRRHSGTRSGGEGGSDPKGDSADEKLKRRQTFHEQRHAMMQSRREQLQEQRQAISQQREAMAQYREAQEQSRRQLEEHRKAQEQQRRGARIEELVDRTRGEPHNVNGGIVGAGSLADIWPSGPAVNENGNGSNTAVTTELNPPVDPNEFQEQIQMLVSMGFEDNNELRTIVRDFGGEVEAVVEFLVNRNRQ